MPIFQFIDLKYLLRVCKTVKIQFDNTRTIVSTPSHSLEFGPPY